MTPHYHHRAGRGGVEARSTTTTVLAEATWRNALLLGQYPFGNWWLLFSWTGGWAVIEPSVQPALQHSLHLRQPPSSTTAAFQPTIPLLSTEPVNECALAPTPSTSPQVTAAVSRPSNAYDEARPLDAPSSTCDENVRQMAENCTEVMSDTLAEIEATGAASTSCIELISSLAMQCKEVLASLQQVIGRTENEEVLARGLAINHRLVLVLEKYKTLCSEAMTESQTACTKDPMTHAALASVDQPTGAALASSHTPSDRTRDHATCSLSASNEDDINKEARFLKFRSETNAIHLNTAPDVPLSYSMSDHDAAKTVSILGGTPASAEQNQIAASSTQLPVQTTIWVDSLQVFESKTDHTITSPAEDTYDL